MSKHTPGPWSCERIWDTHTARIHARVDGGVPVALAEAFTMRETGQREANARLVAAAPDLLALLIELTDIEGPLPGNAAWARKVEAAIAKATQS
jgi:hypothetical protein